MPYVLRPVNTGPSGRNTCSFIGGCYIQGIISGELVPGYSRPPGPRAPLPGYRLWRQGGFGPEGTATAARQAVSVSARGEDSSLTAASSTAQA